MRFNFYEPLTKFFGLLLKTMLILFLFGTLNINKAVSPDRNCTFAVHFTTPSPFEVFLWLLLPDL